MEYIKGSELEKLKNCIIGKDPIKVEVAIYRTVDFLNMEEKTFQKNYPDFSIGEAIKLSCNDNKITPLPQSDYLNRFENFNIHSLKSRANQCVEMAFNPTSFDFYTKNDLPK